MGWGRVVGVGVGVVAGSELRVPEARSAPSEALGSASSRSAELGSGGLPSALGGSSSSQEALLRALSVERGLCAHVLCCHPGSSPGPPGSQVWGHGGENGGGPEEGKAPKRGWWGGLVLNRPAPSPPAE